jgi:hypothetical protein
MSDDKPPYPEVLRNLLSEERKGRRTSVLGTEPRAFS